MADSAVIALRKQLRRLYESVPGLSYRVLSEQVGLAGKGQSLSPTAVGNLLAREGNHIPRLETVMAFVGACIRFASTRPFPNASIEPQFLDLGYWQVLHAEAVDESRANADGQAKADTDVRAILSTNVRVWSPEIHPISALLRPEYQVVKFWGREGALSSLSDWMNEKPRIAVRLYTGSGGMGKTRLMLELCRILESDGWLAGFLKWDSPQFTASLIDRLSAGGRGLFLVVDYAEVRSRQLVQTLESLIEAGVRARVVTLARSIGDWWLNLYGLRRGVGDVLSGPGTSVTALPPLALTSQHRALVYSAALDAFSRALSVGRPGDGVPDLAGEQYDRVLFLHMKALADLHGATATSAGGLLDHILGSEQVRWDDAMEFAGAPILAGRAVREITAVLTLLGEVSGPDRAVEALRRLPVVADQPRAVVERVIDVLRVLYPSDAWMGGVQPDILGEHLVSRVLADRVELLAVLNDL